MNAGDSLQVSTASRAAPPASAGLTHRDPNKGSHIPPASRGESGYDAVLHWLPNTEPDLAGYAVVMRSTTSPVWERETWVGNVTSYVLPDVSIDDVVTSA